ncbi:hypothetical protein GJ496_010799 [Pomphorhynchus laevis]|nr:hypothetical protein GJ496_010799 [Pomphorhynchus laevis]
MYVLNKRFNDFLQYYSVLPDCPIGIENIGNSCFINAVLRSLLSLPEFVDAINSEIVNIPAAAAINDDIDDIDEIQLTTTELLLKNLNLINKYVEFQFTNVYMMKSAIRQIWILTQLDQHRQHDAHEFLLSLFDKLPMCENLFTVHLQNVLKCIRCQYAAINQDKSLDICVAPMDKVRNELSPLLSPSASRSSYNLFNDFDNRKLSDCLKQSFENEYIEDFKCEECKESGILVSKRISALSPIVVICLMRFDYKDSSLTRYSKVMNPIKLSSRIVVPAELNFEQFCLKPAPMSMYRLSAVVSHHGSSPEYGHYICDAELKTPSLQIPHSEYQLHDGFRWYSFDDCDVREKSLTDILLDRQQSAYILFYRKIT